MKIGARAIPRLALCLGAVCAGAAPGGVSFEGFALEPATFHAADALQLANGDARHLVLLGKSGKGGGRFAVYAFEQGRWRNVREGALPADAVLADTMRFADAERIVLLVGGRLVWLDPADWQPKPLAIDALSTIYRGKPDGVAVADMARDIDGDGLDDIVLADFDGLWLVLQEAGGAFAPPVKAPIAPEMHQGWSVSYTAPPIHSFDYDGDGGMDFAALQDGRLQIFASADIAAGPAQLVLPGGIAEHRAAGAASSELKGIADYNGDGIVDICVSVGQSDGNPMDARMQIDFYFGKRVGGALAFPDTPGTQLRSAGFGDVEMRDIDQDGLLDAVVIAGEFSVRKLLSALITRSLSVDMRIYFMAPDGLPDKPSLTRKVTVGEGREPFGFADVDGDRLMDYLQRRDSGLAVYLGERATGHLARRAVEIDVALPFDGRNPSAIEVADLDGDGRDDFLLRYGDPNSPAVGVVMSR